MKTIKSAILATFCIVCITSVSNNLYAQNDVGITYIKVQVDGLACPFCAYGLEKGIKKMKVSKDIFIEINEGYVTFNVPSEKSPTEEELTKIVKDAGFKVRDILFSDNTFKNTTDGK